MLLLFLLSAWLVEPVDQVRLDMNGSKGFETEFHQVTLEKDGTILGVSSYQIYHWEADGSFIRSMGRQGEGPGEFSFITQVLWDGKHYWVFDARSQKSTVFSSSGEYLFTQPLFFRQVIRVDDKLFNLDHSNLHFDPMTYPPVIQPFTYEIGKNEIEVFNTGRPFKKVTELQMDLHYNFKLVWMAAEGDSYLVVDQLEPKMRVFTPTTIEIENAIPVSKIYEPEFVPIQARRWIEPPKTSKLQRRSSLSARKWWHSFSRINFFGKLDRQDLYVVAYTTPDVEDDLASKQIIQAVNRKGEIVGPIYEGEGLVSGSKNSQVFVYETLEMDEHTEHGLSIYQF